MLAGDEWQFEDCFTYDDAINYSIKNEVKMYKVAQD